MMKLLGRIVVIAAVLAAMAVPSSAQSLTGAIGGRVVDEQGGALPGVSLTLDRRHRQHHRGFGRQRLLPVPGRRSRHL